MNTTSYLSTHTEMALCERAVKQKAHSPNILQVSVADILGGAEKVAFNLFKAYWERGLNSWLAVGKRHSDDPGVFTIPNDDYRRSLARLWISIGNKVPHLDVEGHVTEKLRRFVCLLGQPRRLLEKQRGYENFDFPATRELPELTPEPPDIIHCHNLHGSYFDLRTLPWLSKQAPVILTLHDAWLLGGGCYYSFECERWKTGCGSCPQLGKHLTVRKDGTAYNWQRKREIYAKSCLYIATPSRWLMQRVEQSMLAQAIVETKVIPNGVDLTLFHPEDRRKARKLLGIPEKAKVLLFAGNRAKSDPRKDYATAESAALEVAKQLPEHQVILVCLGEKGKVKHIGQAEFRSVGYEKEAKKVAGYYQAADIYVSASKADNFPNTVLESLACGTPVVATAVGGIPEQVDDGMSGFLVPPQNPRAMANRIRQLLSDNDLHRRFSIRAAEDAKKRFDLNRQVDDYLNWYEEISERDSSLRSE